MGDLSCKLKIIQDGQNIIGLTSAVCEVADNLPDDFLSDESAYPIIECLNKAEGLLIEAQKKLAKAYNYDGPLPKFLQ